MRRISSLSSMGAAIRGARREAGFTQAQLAKRSGVSRGTIIKIESGGRFDIGGLLALARALDLDLALVPRREPAFSLLEDTEEL